MAKLIVLSQNPPIEHELKEYNTIGRMPKNTIQILDRLFSKIHAHIVRLKDGRYFLKDLGSLNGIFVKGQRVKEYWLKDGDEITMGNALLKFIGDGVPQPEKPEVLISRERVDTEIHQIIEAGAGSKFLPEKKILDANVLKRDYERLRIAHEVTAYLGVEANFQDLLYKILKKIFEVFICDRGVIFLPDEYGEMKPAVSRQRRHYGKKNDIVVSHTILDEVAKKKAAVLSSDASADRRFKASTSIIMQGIRSAMSVPLIYSDKLLGIIYLDSRLAAGAFTKKDLSLLTTIANQAAIAVQNTNLIKEIEREAKTRTQFEKLLSLLG